MVCKDKYSFRYQNRDGLKDRADRAGAVVRLNASRCPHLVNQEPPSTPPAGEDAEPDSQTGGRFSLLLYSMHSMCVSSIYFIKESYEVSPFYRLES